ncbi:Glutamate receptor ionotropic, kainate 2 [Folsomia candida]|uniref:Glutamate receptor ionotropic, kainate 2 n=2 Tax=Folsomia candida TaxID=158441 RepID=A0A226EYW5_FOLCA|nr:Glutamate receptor ionotropic, kainate 2 [Folsomia candida]
MLSDRLQLHNSLKKCNSDDTNFDFCGIPISLAKKSEDIGYILKKVHSQISSSFSFLALILDNNNTTSVFPTLEEISRLYSDESRLKRPFSVFLLTYSPDENNLLQLEILKSTVKKLPWQISLFVCELDLLHDIRSVWELITFTPMPFTKRILLTDIGPDFFLTILSRKSTEDLHGSLVRALAIDSPDERYSAEFNRNKSIPTFIEGGYTVSLLNDLRDALNFSVLAVIGKEYITDQTVNQTVGGIGAQLLNNEADLIISMSYALEFRVKYLSPTVAFNKDKVMVFFRQPSLFLNRNVFLHPFQDTVWISLLVTLSLIAISTLMTIRIPKHFMHKKHPEDQPYFWILGALCQKSCSCEPHKIHGRIILLVTFLMAWIVYTFYSASIISRLSVSYNPITTLSGLINGGFNLLADPLVSYSKYLQFSSTQDWEMTFVSEVDSVSKVFNGGYGFISSIDLVVIASRNLQFSEQNICDTLSSVSLNIVMPLQFYTRKGYPFKELVNRKLLNLIGKGFNDRYLAEFLWHTNPVCPEIVQTTFESLGFTDLYSAFFGLAFVYALTLAILSVEKSVHKFHERSTFEKVATKWYNRIFKRATTLCRLTASKEQINIKA